MRLQDCEEGIGGRTSTRLRAARCWNAFWWEEQVPVASFVASKKMLTG